MPRYEVRLESTDSFIEKGVPHFRETTLVADSEDEARRACVRRELEAVLFELPAEELAVVEDAEADGSLTSQQKGELFQHRTETAYEVVSVTELKEG